MQKAALQKLDSATWHRFVTIAKPFFVSNEKHIAFALLVVLVSLSIVVTKLSVWMSEIAGNYMTALSDRNGAEFYRNIWLFALAVACTTPVAVMYRYTEEKLALRWRRWLTQHYLDRYFSHRSYYRLNIEKSLDNPDQRMTDEIRNFTGTTLSLLLIFLNAVINLWVWSRVLWSMSGVLAATSFLYAFLGSVVAMIIGRRLVSLNFAQQKKEADFRYRLVQVRDNSESIALYRGESKEASHTQQRLRDAVQNLALLIGWNRNLGFFTRTYDYFKGLVPVVIIAPLYFGSGDMKFGALTQATIAFAWVLDALSVIVSQFERLSAFAATVSRLGALSEELDHGDRYCVWPRENPSWITIGESSELVLHNLTVMTPNRKRTLVRDLSVSLDPERRLLITGASGVGKTALFRAIAGLWTDGQGTVLRPELEDLVFLPQTPYMIQGSFRQQLLYSIRDDAVSDDDLRDALAKVRLGDLLERVGGFEVEWDWANVLSLGEQQRIAFARLILARPRIGLLDESTTALDAESERHLYSLLRETKIRYVSIGHRASLLEHHDVQLDLGENGAWKLSRVGG